MQAKGEFGKMNRLSRTFRFTVATAALLLTAAAAQATSIVAIKTGDDIYIGTDSKVLIENDVPVSQCKISRMNDVYLVFSGIPSFPLSGFNAYEIADRIFKEPGTIGARLDMFDKAVQGKLQAAFEKLRKTNDKLFS